MPYSGHLTPRNIDEDLFSGGTITGNLTINGNLTVNGNFNFGQAAVENLFLGDDDYIGFGNTAAAPDCRILWNTTQTVDALYIGLATAQNTLIIAESGDVAYDFAHGAQTHPTLFVQSANQSATEFSKLTAGGLSFGLGIAVTSTEYSVGRDADATNQLHFNVPAAATMEWSVGDVSAMTMSSAASVTTLNIGTAGTFGSKINFISNNSYINDSGIVYGSGSASIAMDLYRPIVNGDSFQFENNSLNVTYLTLSTAASGTGAGLITHTPAAFNTGSPTLYTLTAPAHVTLSNADLTDVYFNLGRSVQFTGAAGATTINNTYGLNLAAPTFTTAGAGAMAITNASTLYINNAPQAGAGGGGTTITNPYALFVDAGRARFDGSIMIGRSTADVSNPPTDAELDSAFGDPTTLGSGFIGIVDDNDGGTNNYFVWTTGTAGEWFWVQGTKAL